MFLIHFEWNLHGNGWIGGGLGVREHPQCLVVNLEGCSYIQQKALTFNRNQFWNKLDYSCMLETNRPTQNDRNDQEIISGFW